MKNRLLAAGLAVPLALGLAACASSSTVSGQGSDSGNGPTSSSDTGGSQGVAGGATSSTPSTSTSSGTSPSVSLAAKLAQGLSSARTAHLALTINASGHAITGRGDEKLSNGKLVALDLSETVAQGVAVRIIVVGGKAYIRLPGSLNSSGKPWQVASANSSNPAVRSFASSLSSTQSSASLSSVTAFVSAARSVKQTGSSTYAVDVDPSKLPATFQGRKALLQSGLTSIPIVITLDSQGRPVLVTEHLSVEGQQVSTKITISAYNRAVHISAPPKSQVSTH